MKHPVIIFMLFFSVETIYAQNMETPDNRDGIDNILTVKPKTLKLNFPQAKILFTTEKGKVYALPQDNMPCLVPNINSNMPVADLSINKTRKIPNALPEQKIIPEKGILDLRKKNK
ncbi:MAG TPA: hypothetical protein VMY77_12060 [Chitinophagaceae bacterium]|nr:hypothetical protein [Chitinophagaceae bacterium]